MDVVSNYSSYNILLWLEHSYGDVSGSAAGEDVEVGVNSDSSGQVGGGLRTKGSECLRELLLISTWWDSTTGSLSRDDGAGSRKAGKEEGQTHGEDS